MLEPEPAESAYTLPEATAKIKSLLLNSQADYDEFLVNFMLCLFFLILR